MKLIDDNERNVTLILNGIFEKKHDMIVDR